MPRISRTGATSGTWNFEFQAKPSVVTGGFFFFPLVKEKIGRRSDRERKPPARSAKRCSGGFTETPFELFCLKSGGGDYDTPLCVPETKKIIDCQKPSI